MITFKKPTLVMLKGLPASGKSTWAKQVVAENEKVFRVNKDDLREMTQGKEFLKSNESNILQIRDEIVRIYLKKGYSIIVDDTNFLPDHENQLRKIANECSALFTIKEFNVPVEECIARDALREKSVGKDAILKLDKQRQRYQIDKYIPDTSLPPAVIVDIDGTIAKMKDRSPYDYKRVGEDEPQKDVIALVNLLFEQGYKILIVSGRDSSCREETKQWLDISGIHGYSELFMREEGDRRKDNIVKYEIFNKFIRDKYCVNYVLDDRNQVVEIWRKLGLRTLQVADGNF